MLLVSLLALHACKDNDVEKDSPPVIEFVNYELVKAGDLTDSILHITFNYEDANGDLGLDRWDTFPPFEPGSEFQFNLHVQMLDCGFSPPRPLLLSGGPDTMNFNQRIPVLTPTGKNKFISGTMTVSFDARSLVLYPDTVQSRLRIFDRALNPSNTIETTCIALTH